MGVYGDGRVGVMGAFAAGITQAGGKLHGITPKFFTAAQGEFDALNKTREIVDTMSVRMRRMREMAQVSKVHPGFLGTHEEFFEWLNARNGIIKPLILVNTNGYYEGLNRFLEGSIENGYASSSLKHRYCVVKDPEQAMEVVHVLNARAAMPEMETTIIRKSVSGVYEELDRAIIVRPGSFKSLEKAFSTLVGYDISNIPGQTQHPQGAPLKPVIFTSDKNGHFDGLREQFNQALEAGFTDATRLSFFRFAESEEHAADIVHDLSCAPLVMPQHLINQSISI